MSEFVGVDGDEAVGKMYGNYGQVWKLWAEGDEGSIIDPLISDPLNKKEIDRSIVVGLLCVQENVNDRPNMSNVMSMFSSEIADLPRPKEPGFNKRRVYGKRIACENVEVVKKIKVTPE